MPGWQGELSARPTATSRYGAVVSREISVAEALTPSDDLLVAIRALVEQLSRTASPLTREDLEDLIESPASRLLIARRGEGVVGMLTVVLFRIPTGVRAWVEDVVVDGSARGQGVGRRLLSTAVKLARGAGARTVDLTSRPDRHAANTLYVQAGFVLRESNLYRITL
jgi:ribosomal protein S18 acetylase RimI-like enzyme